MKVHGVEIKKLKRSQIKQMIADGADPGYFTEASAEKNDKFIDYILEKFYPELNQDDYENAQLEAVALETYKKSRFQAAETKN